MSIIFWIIVIAFLVVIGPLVTIWSLNTLFPVLALDYTFWAWLATVCLFGFIHGNPK